MGIFTPSNPLSDGGLAGRIDDIKAAYASGKITKGQYDELMADESATASFIGMKRAGLAILLLTVGVFMVLANL